MVSQQLLQLDEPSIAPSQNIPPMFLHELHSRVLYHPCLSASWFGSETFAELTDRSPTAHANEVLKPLSPILLRRTPDCPIDLSRLAGSFGGGGHPAASGCLIETNAGGRAEQIARKLQDALVRGVDR